VDSPGAISPTSPGRVSPATTTMKAKKSQENLKAESPDTYEFSNHRRPFHSQSSTSLSSVFTDTATSPTSFSSPFFTSDSACGPSPFVGNHQPVSGQPGSNKLQRPRSQTLPKSMQPSPLPVASQISDKGSSADPSPVTPSQEEAARALELVLNFFQSQNAGFVVEPQVYVTIGKLMEKLREPPLQHAACLRTCIYSKALRQSVSKSNMSFSPALTL
jgi:hypothetical protein